MAPLAPIVPGRPKTAGERLRILSMRSELLIYGVTGYTGALISRLAAAAGLPHVAGGRDLERVARHADRLMVPTRAFSLVHPAKIDRALQGIAVVLNAAGPFAETAMPLAEACLRGGVHYLDLAGGAPEIEALQRLDARGREAGVMLMAGVGFAIMPTDALAARLRRRLPSAVRLRLASEAVGRMSRGALLTLIHDFCRQGVRRRGGELVAARAADEIRRLDLGGGPRWAVANPWRGDVVTAWWSSVFADIEIYTVLPSVVRWLLRFCRLPAARAVGANDTVQAALRWLAHRLPPGPDESQLAAGLTRVWAQAEDAAGGRVTALLRGPDVHLFTARLALWVAGRALAGRVRVGFQTPATAFGPDLLARLAEEIEGLEITAG
jgi:short subunit dehydrogenase-like uncharacterized protein